MMGQLQIMETYRKSNHYNSWSPSFELGVDTVVPYFHDNVE